MLRLGCHISSAKGYLAMGRQAAEIGANCLQFFLRNPRGGRAKAINLPDIQDFIAYAKEHDIGPIMAHASYVLNPATPHDQTDAERLNFVKQTMADDLTRMELTPGNLYNFHPGHAPDREAGLERVAQLLNQIMSKEQTTAVLLETMTGGQTSLGTSFEDLAAIINAVDLKDKMGVCLDTCHVFGAGYDLVNDLDGVLRKFDQVLGLDKLKAVHLNDSKFPLASQKDRHAAIGEGHIGLTAFVRLLKHPDLSGLPFILETPQEADGYAAEIKLLREHL